MTNSVESVVEALRHFVPTEDGTDNVHRLYQIFKEFRTLPGRERALSEMFAFLERFPEADLGSPGPIVHELEAIVGYRPVLSESLRRKPTSLTVWMANRILNGEPRAEEYELWFGELRTASNHPLASEEAKQAAREFLKHQLAKV